MADIQTERAYQKQPTIFQNKKRVLLGDTAKEKLPRYYKNIGLGFKTPRRPSRAPTLTRSVPSLATSPSEAGSCLGGDQDEDAEDHRHPRLPALHPQYNRLREAPQEHVRAPVTLLQRRPDRRHCDCGECRPLSKTVRFNVLKVTKAAGTKKQFQKF
uniref:Small ribosomal subunit protein uS17 N-terminal domain-containing protein n=1 Tax=Sarcophilus harrisii TaxID=9305 RepID=G3VRA8_SARHA